MYTSHGDAHNQNWSVAEFNSKAIVSFIDLDKFGPYRIGWDEARMYAKLTDHAEDQKNLLEAIQVTHYFSEEEQLYFWRTVVVRALRDTQLLLKGKLINNPDQIQKASLTQKYLIAIQDSFQQLQTHLKRV